MSCCVEQTNGVPPGSGGGGSEGQLLFDLDWRALGAQVIADGANVIDGRTWNGSNIASGATLVDVQPGVGLAFDANLVSTNYTTASRTAARIAIPLSSLVPTWQDTWSVFIESFWTLLTLPNGNNRVCIACDAIGTTVNELLGMGKRNTAGNLAGYTQLGTGFGGFNVNFPTHDAIAMRIDARGGNSIAGVYDIPGDRFPAPYTNSAGAVIATSPTATPAMGVGCDLVIAFVTGSAAGTMAAALGRIRGTLVED